MMSRTGDRLIAYTTSWYLDCGEKAKAAEKRAQDAEKKAEDALQKVRCMISSMLKLVFF